MIVDYPCPMQRIWTPKGMRRFRSFVYDEAVPIEIREIEEIDAPLVASVTTDDENVSYRYRVVNGEWFVDGSSPTMASIVENPRILRFCQNSSSIEGFRGIYRDGVELSSGPTEHVAGSSALPAGRDCAPFGYDPSDGRRDEILKAAADLVLVGGEVFRRSVEPTLRVRVTTYLGSKPSVSLDVGDHDPVSGGGLVLRLDRLDLAKEIAVDLTANVRGHLFGKGNVEVYRPDLLRYDAFEGGVRSFARDMLYQMSNADVVERSSTWFQAFAELRDLSGGVEAKVLSSPGVVDVERLYEATLRCADVAVAEDYSEGWTGRSIHDRVREASAGFGEPDDRLRLEEDLAPALETLRRLDGVDHDHGRMATAGVHADDLAALGAPRP